MRDLPNGRLSDGKLISFQSQREKYKPKWGNDPDIGAREVISPSEHNDLAGSIGGNPHKS